MPQAKITVIFDAAVEVYETYQRGGVGYGEVEPEESDSDEDEDDIVVSD